MATIVIFTELIHEISTGICVFFVESFGQHGCTQHNVSNWPQKNNINGDFIVKLHLFLCLSLNKFAFFQTSNCTNFDRNLFSSAKTINKLFEEIFDQIWEKKKYFNNYKSLEKLFFQAQNMEWMWRFNALYNILYIYLIT